MALDGFSLSSIKLNMDLTSAQMTNHAEQIAAKETEIKIPDVTSSAEKKGIKEKEGEGTAGGGGFSDSKHKEEEKNEEDFNFDEKELERKDPKEFSVRVNPKTEMIELYNNKNRKIVETISATDLMSLISKMNSASGVLVNRKI